jgi:hypothetical protein
VLPSKSVFALILAFVCPSFNSLAMLKIVLPLTFIHRTVDMLINTWSISLVICPETIINIAVNVDKLSLAVGSIFTPLA